MHQNEDEQEDQSKEHEIKKGDGAVRYWMFLNGEGVRLFSALAASFFAVLWCFLYVFGAGQSTAGIILIVLAIASFVIWRAFDKQLRAYQESAWKKDKHSPRRDKTEVRVAILLWLFIFISAGVILLRQWWRAH